MRSYLVVGNQTLDSPELAQAIADRVASGPSTFHVVVPATPVQRGLTWDVSVPVTVVTTQHESVPNHPG